MEIEFSKKPQNPVNPVGQSSKVALAKNSLGVIIKPHGIKGGLRFYLSDSRLDRHELAPGQELKLVKANGESRVVQVEKVNWDNHFKNKNIVLLDLTGLTDRSEADTMKNAQLISLNPSFLNQEDEENSRKSNPYTGTLKAVKDSSENSFEALKADLDSVFNSEVLDPELHSDLLTNALVDQLVSFEDQNGLDQLASIRELYKTPAHWIVCASGKNGLSYEFPLVQELLELGKTSGIRYLGGVLEGDQ